MCSCSTNCAAAAGGVHRFSRQWLARCSIPISFSRWPLPAAGIPGCPGQPAISASSGAWRCWRCCRMRRCSHVAAALPIRRDSVRPRTVGLVALQQATISGLAHAGGPVSDRQQAKQLRGMVFHRGFGDTDDLRDLLVRIAGGYQFEYLLLLATDTRTCAGLVTGAPVPTLCSVPCCGMVAERSIPAGK